MTCWIALQIRFLDPMKSSQAVLSFHCTYFFIVFLYSQIRFQKQCFYFQVKWWHVYSLLHCMQQKAQNKHCLNVQQTWNARNTLYTLDISMQLARFRDHNYFSCIHPSTYTGLQYICIFFIYQAQWWLPIVKYLSRVTCLSPFVKVKLKWYLFM